MPSTVEIHTGSDAPTGIQHTVSLIAGGSEDGVDMVPSVHVQGDIGSPGPRLVGPAATELGLMGPGTGLYCSWTPVVADGGGRTVSSEATQMGYAGVQCAWPEWAFEGPAVLHLAVPVAPTLLRAGVATFLPPQRHE
jgi:hypothetical protein